ncbi:TPR repeat-containing protein [Catenulispora acidiphila DSM 44928]|uniref:TPR repeat-containing protein n=1 Tax=Catenulispora acidiphila (strain DSM 44928 / JCM 14897 / NBRC 102108 / NRRL B-24433 / ID139908) TaxID=479433 RepID=C7QC18_CATAD|nr:tetratricopeptide repeat protein [Catenulispora acidiphila]ACU72637.1 TPR repeat-containing protein [Catenulispora acidiphila DSM 44928]
MNATPHLWLCGGLRRDRERRLDEQKPAPMLGPVLDAHRRLRGPYTAAGTLLRAIVPDALREQPDLVARQDLEILAMAQELRGIVPATRETLTSLAAPEERTRYYSKLRTTRISHGTAEFLRDYAATLGRPDSGPQTLVVENAEHADPTDAEFLAILLRRIDPAVLRVVVCSGDGELPPGPLHDALEQYATRVDVAAGAPTAAGLDLAADPHELAAAYVRGDCTSDEPLLLAAYQDMDPHERRRLHDDRAAELESRGEPSLGYGAIPFHREHGADPEGAGVQALQKAIDDLSLLGYYHATIELAIRLRQYVGWEGGRRRYFATTSRLSTAYAVLEEPDKCEELYDEARRNSTDPEVHMGAAYATAMLYTRHYEKSKIDHDRGRALVNQAIAIASLLPDPKYRAIHSVFMNNGLALVEMHQGSPEEALRLVSDCIAQLDREMEPGEYRLHRSVLHHNRANVYRALGRFEEAAAEFSTVIGLDPNYPEYYFDRGNLYRLMDREDEAYADYETAIRLSPPFHEAFYNRGDIRAARGDVDGALADFDYVLDIDPEFVDARVNRAALLLELGEDAAAEQDARAGLAVDPDNAHLHTALGQINALRGDTEQSLAAFSRALDTDPEHVPALAGRAVVRFDAADHTAARADLDEAIRLQPEDPALLFNRAMVFKALHHWPDAIADLLAAAHLAPGDEDVDQALQECRDLAMASAYQ